MVTLWLWLRERSREAWSKPKEPHRRPTLTDRMIGTLNWERIIERSFRYLEMIAVSAALAAVLDAAYPPMGAVVGLLLAIWAGVYLALPFDAWLHRLFGRRPAYRVVPLSFAPVLTLAVASAVFSGSLQILFSATFQIDGEMTRARIEEWNARQALSGCARPTVMSYEEFLECQRVNRERLRHWRGEVERLRHRQAD